jgi:hypothetical protein
LERVHLNTVHGRDSALQVALPPAVMRKAFSLADEGEENFRQRRNKNLYI